MIASTWALDPGLAHLNHGGFGATPLCVLEEQQARRAALERNPTDFLVRRLPDLLAAERTRVADFVGAGEDGLVFVDNAFDRDTDRHRPGQARVRR